MTAEHADNARDPERRAFYHRPGPQAEHVIATVLARLHRVEDELRVIDGYLTHGAGFAAYLRLDDTAPHEAVLLERYEQCYADAWASLDDLATDTVEALGWREALTELTDREGIPADALTWNPRAIYGQLHEMYSFVELDGLLHDFHR